MPVKVLVVDDSPLIRQLIVEALEKDPDVQVVGTAENGQQAIEQAAALRPQVITMDVDMPVMDGLTATERIMADYPTPILVLTADPRNQAPELTHRALAVGALALRVKPAAEAEMAHLAREVKLLATIRVIRHVRGVKKVPGSSHSQPTLPLVAPQPFAPTALGVICIASSTGGPQVVQKLLTELPADFPVPLAIVQHINAAFSDSLVGWLASASKLKVRVAKDNDLLTPGTVLLAPPDAHLVIATRGKVSVTSGGPRDGHLPSATLLLESAARAYARRAVGVILTGMGNDGVDGLAAIRTAGGKTIAQSQDSSVVFGMPGAAIARGIVDHVVSGDDLASTLIKLARGQEVARV
ncbi:MAG: chemotaxis-specific protein-glutamate methyltransferase CheB [Archangium sp.]|nr:chemotaxis-specific protein-glutamate methyltransferase CheB [Archangium sp.]MDP3152704.1 chemotaxis-specific protein-glutamate methyltransferase CheB [Archangium sp.]MDP3574840.1 chemotaxis-specific protein-glutamate methyltransferase CheB [Archangium sp.]